MSPEALGTIVGLLTVIGIPISIETIFNADWKRRQRSSWERLSKFCNATDHSVWRARVSVPREEQSQIGYGGFYSDKIIEKDVVIDYSSSPNSIYIGFEHNGSQIKQQISVDDLLYKLPLPNIKTVNKVTKIKKGVRMPKAFRWSLNAAWVYLVWRVVLHADEISAFIINKWL